MASQRLVQLDGRTGEGGGQLLRVAVALSAVTGTPVRVTHVRGNRAKNGSRGGGLKSQHKTALQFLADVTRADTEGLEVGSHTFQFVPGVSPSQLLNRNIKITAESAAASTLLIFQAVLPFLLFAGDEGAHPIELELSGGTNVAFSLSYDYLDQVLLPCLDEWFGIKVDRVLKARGWSLGPQSRGLVWMRIHPLRPGETLKPKHEKQYNKAEDFEVRSITATLVVPAAIQAELQDALGRDLATLFSDTKITFSVEDSGSEARIYTLLVAHTAGGLRYGRDILTSTPRKGKSRIASEVSRKISKELFEEVSHRAVVDEYLQDQVVIFQALAEGRSSFPRTDELVDEGGEANVAELDAAMADLKLSPGMRKDKNVDEPFGHGSLHTKTARWVVSEMLPSVAFFNQGLVCDGSATKSP